MCTCAQKTWLVPCCAQMLHATHSAYLNTIPVQRVTPAVYCPRLYWRHSDTHQLVRTETSWWSGYRQPQCSRCCWRRWFACRWTTSAQHLRHSRCSSVWQCHLSLPLGFLLALSQSWWEGRSERLQVKEKCKYSKTHTCCCDLHVVVLVSCSTAHAASSNSRGHIL